MLFTAVCVNYILNQAMMALEEEYTKLKICSNLNLTLPLSSFSLHFHQACPVFRLVNMNHYLPQGVWSAVTCYNASLAVVC